MIMPQGSSMRWSKRCSCIVILAAACCFNFAAAIGFCDPVQNSGKPAPNLPNTFQAKIEMKDLVRNMTTEMQIWNEFQLNVTRVQLVQESKQFDLFYSFATQEIFYVEYRSLQCLVINMSVGGDFDIIIGKNVSGLIVQDDAASMFRLNSAFGIKYEGSNFTVRGLPAEKWSSCQYWPERKSEFTVHWYFAAPGWDSVSQTQSPLRIEITGISNRTFPIDTNSPFHLVYDFLFYRPYLESSESVFQTPRGAYCDRRIKTKSLPNLSPVMIFTWEAVNGRRDLVTSVNYGRMSFDSQQQIIRFDSREPGSLMKPPFYNIGTLTIIQDFKSGVAYFIDNVYGNCTARPIGSELFDLDDLESSDRPGWHLLVMRNPRDVFQFDDNYQYEGKAMVRGLPVDVFISLRQIKVANQPMNVTFEYYILDESVTEIGIAGSGKIGKGVSIPVELRVVSYTELGPDADPTFSYYERFNFFNFDAPDFDSDPNANLELTQQFLFDIGNCYKEEDKINFMLKFAPLAESASSQYAANQTNLFIRGVIDQINKAEMGLVNGIRFQNPKVDYDDKSVYFLATLLDKPDVYYQYVRITDFNPTVLSIDGNMKFTTEKDCLEACYSGNECRSVAYCDGPNLPNGMNCLLSSQFGSKKNDAPYTCSVFVSPTNSSSSLTELNLEDAWNYMSMAVSNKQINVTLTGINGTDQQQQQQQQKAVSYIASDIERYIIRPDNFNSLQGKHLNRFDATKQKTFDFKNSKFKNRKLLNKISADECAKSCLDEFSFSCNSVVYCFDIGSCHLTEETVADDGNNLFPRARCNVYQKNPLSQYTEYPGQSQIFIKGKNPIAKVHSASECAEFCNANANANSSSSSSSEQICRGFDVCDSAGDKLCFLDAGHITDSGSTGANRSECSHFAQTFEADFAKSGSLVSPDFAHLRVVAEISQSACARYCTEKLGADCMGFYFCKASAQCALRLIGDSEPKIGEGTEKCDFMKRLYNPDGSVYQITQPQTGGEFFKGFSVPLAVTLYILTALIGFVLGSVIVVAILHSRGNSVWRDIKALFTRR